MTTDVMRVDPAAPDPVVIDRAAAVIRSGGLVAFPTETVYGLGANAFDPTAVGRIFAAKGRPATNPVIVHVAETADVLNVAAAWPATAAALADRFWPGPLTLVLPKGPVVPDVVTGGGLTVAVRCPAHPVARSLIRAAGVPIAAPSANRSTQLSPTRAEHVLKGLDGRVDVVLDGGACPGGIESTVVDATGNPVRVLRPGLVTAPMLETVIGNLGPAEYGNAHAAAAPSPGLLEKHYSPRKPVILVTARQEADALQARMARDGVRAIVVGFDRFELCGGGASPVIELSRDPGQCAAELYTWLHLADDEPLWDTLIIELPPDAPEWTGIRDRLIRAAGRGHSY